MHLPDGEALDKLGFRHLFNCHQVEVVQPSIAFDVASLMLYGTQAIPVRLKILLDRLFSVLQHDEVLKVLHGFGWTYEDYARGYIMQDASGAVLDRWLLASREEEPLILQQFLRFGETKSIAQQLLLQESSERTDFVVHPQRTDSDIKKFIERTNRGGGSSLFKQHSSHIYSHMGCPPPLPKAAFRLPSTSSNQSASPTMSSPPTLNCASPLALSPLNKLQNMQPYDFRQQDSSAKHRNTSPDLPKGGEGVTYPPPPASSFGPSSLSNNSSYTTASSERSGNEASDDEENAAINLTRSSLTVGHGYMDSVYAAKKVRHLRKSANPMKRRWNPTVLATLSTNPATGKKRVQCHVCLKTFCDKGALKIHFSAVHLREMHKCTVDGCNMMFSSRRSRNRHSANPNPKLHTPNYRRKMNPNDGRAANPYPIIPPSGMMDFSNGIVNYSSGAHDGESSSASEDDHRPVTPPMDVKSVELKKETVSPQADKLPRMDDDGPLPLTKRFRIDPDVVNKYDEEGIDLSLKEDRKQSENFVDGFKNFKVEEAEKTAENLTSPTKSDEKLSSDNYNGLKVNSERSDSKGQNSESVVRSMEKDRLSPSNKGVRKRKSLNPTKCRTTSDDDLAFVSSDDSSSDTYIDQDNDENGVLDSKSDYLTSDGSDSMNDLDDMDDNSDTETDKFAEIKASRKSSATSQTSSVVVTTAQSSTTKSGSVDKDNHDRYNGFSMSDVDKFRHESSANRIKDGEDICENPLRHLESLSLGAFTNMMNVSNRSNFNNHHRANNVSSGVSYHAPGLGLASVTTTTASTNNHRVESPAMDMLPTLVSSSGSHIPPPNCHSSNNNNSDTDNSMSEQQMGMVPVYRDASMVGSVEIPVDKENPRRCTACGKIFQNHFGVKTHYQNVHLKLMHKCTVEGCNAAFPSKRSRDRHSANLNLHRKLLSTSSDRSGGGYFDKAIYPFHPDTYRGDIFTRLYDHNSLPLSFADIYHNRLSAEGAGSPFLGGSPFAHLPGAMPGFHPAFLPTMANFNKNDGGDDRFAHDQNSARNSSLSSISNPSSPGPSPPGDDNRLSPSVKLEEDLVPDTEGRFSCTICEKKFHEGIVLREHYEKSHTQSLLHCSTNGCNKVFLSKQSRSNHSDNRHKEKAIHAT